MSVTIANVPVEKLQMYSASELQVGVLYKILDDEYHTSRFGTIYTRAYGDIIVWFETERIGTNPVASCGKDKFILAPKNTTVILRA